MFILVFNLAAAIPFRNVRSASGVSRRRLAFSGLFSLSKETRLSFGDNSASRRRIAFLSAACSVPGRRPAFLSAITVPLEGGSLSFQRFVQSLEGHPLPFPGFISHSKETSRFLQRTA